MPDSWDDEELLAALREALDARQAVPPGFVETGKNAYAWHNIDAELASSPTTPPVDAELAPAISGRDRVDPHAHLQLGPAVDRARGRRGTRCSARSSRRGRHGRVADPGRAGGDRVDVDEIGCFSIEPIPRGPFRLRCRTTDGGSTW